jgi:hypothetical protein
VREYSPIELAGSVTKTYIKRVEKEGINLAIIAANNHYSGFGSGTVNIFRQMLGLPDAKWEQREEEEQQQQKHISHDSKQRTLSDFLSYTL